MKLELTSELREFRDKVTGWIHDHAPSGLNELVDWSTPWGNMARYSSSFRRVSTGCTPAPSLCCSMTFPTASVRSHREKRPR